MRRIIIGMVLLLFGGGLIWYFMLGKGVESPSGRVVVTGNIEVTEVALSFKIPGMVVARPVAEGERVAAGQLVARLDTLELEQEVALKQAELAAVHARLAELEAGYRTEEVAQARAALRKAQAEEKNARDNYERQKRLFKEKVIPEKEYDNAAASYGMARQSMKEAGEKLAMLEKGHRPEQIAAARAQVDQALAAQALAGTRLDYATLVSPLAGLVLTENVEPGEYVNPGTPVITVGKLDQVWLRAFINQTDLGRIRSGQKALITTDTYPDRRYEGRVSFIASEAEFTPKQVQTDQQRVKLMYRIKITVPNPQMELKPGMPADAVILLENKNHETAGN
jgi:HlyD family secretion protein